MRKSFFYLVACSHIYVNFIFLLTHARAHTRARAHTHTHISYCYKFGFLFLYLNMMYFYLTEPMFIRHVVLTTYFQRHSYALHVSWKWLFNMT